MSDEDWEQLDLKAASTIQFYLANEIMYNMIDEEMATGLWSRLETLYITKSLSNKMYLKKKLYGLRIKKETVVFETARSCGYEDVTAMYIWRSEIPSHIYAKHQYRQESECGSTRVMYISIQQYKYIVITECNLILQ